MTLTQPLFEKLIDALREQSDKDCERASQLSLIYGSDINPSDNRLLTNAIFEVFETAYGTEGLMDIEYFCFEQDYGRKVNKSATQLWQEFVNKMDVNL